MKKLTIIKKCNFTLSSWLSSFKSLIFISRISLGSSVEPVVPGLTIEDRWDELAATSLDAEDIFWSTPVAPLSKDCDSPVTFRSPSCSTFTLFILESPPYKKIYLPCHQVSRWRMHRLTISECHFSSPQMLVYSSIGIFIYRHDQRISEKQRKGKSKQESNMSWSEGHS